jgi:hypothetical protein
MKRCALRVLAFLMLSAPAWAQPPAEPGAGPGSEPEAVELPPGVELVEAGGPLAPQPKEGHPRVKLGGYLDLGAFKAQGRGTGFIFDTADRFSQRHPGIAWILLGDPLSTAVNSRGEPADLSGSLAFTDDPIQSRGAFSFIINEVNLELSATLSERVFAFASLDVMPRGGLRGPVDTRLELDYAYVEYQPFGGWDVVFSAGKLDPAFGREYRIQESVDRPGVTPSLLFRYVGGQPVGLKGRGVFLDGRVTAALLVANGSSFFSLMQQQQNVDRTSLKTASGRLSGKVGPSFATLEVGLSGEAGPQSRQTDPSLLHWQWGFDAVLETRPLEVRAELVRGISQGGGLEDVDGLDYRAFFIEALWRAHARFGVLGRFEERHALNWRGTEFLYLIHIRRVVAGARVVLQPGVFLKAEYLRNLELDPLPSFDNDVFASSLVVQF